MVYISSDTIFLKLFHDNIDDEKVLLKLLSVSKLKELLIIFELCKNILLGNIPITVSCKNYLRKYEFELIELSKKTKLINSKVNILKKNIKLFQALIEIGGDFIL